MGVSGSIRVAGADLEYLNYFMKVMSKGRSSALAALSEAHVTRQIVDFLRAEGWLVLRLQSGLFQRPNGHARIRIGEPGLPDYLAMRCTGGRPQSLFIEIKAAGEKLRPAQEAWILDARRRGFTAEVFDDYDAFLDFYWPYVHSRWAKNE